MKSRQRAHKAPPANKRESGQAQHDAEGARSLDGERLENGTRPMTESDCFPTRIWGLEAPACVLTSRCQTLMLVSQLQKALVDR